VALTPAALLAPDGNAAIVGHDETKAACLRYVAIEDRVTELLAEWASLEHQLANRHDDFFRLSRHAQRRLPGARRFLEIEKELDLFDAERDKLLSHLSSMRSTTPGAVLAKLMVAVRIIHPEEHPAAHRMIADSINDLDRLLSARGS